MIDKGLMTRVKLSDGKRGFQFTSLAKKLAKGINLSHQLAGKEVLDA
jgi:DNA polymerase III gamma/tau subunit